MFGSSFPSFSLPANALQTRAFQLSVSREAVSCSLVPKELYAISLGEPSAWEVQAVHGNVQVTGEVLEEAGAWRRSGGD